MYLWKETFFNTFNTFLIFDRGHLRTFGYFFGCFDAHVLKQGINFELKVQNWVADVKHWLRECVLWRFLSVHSVIDFLRLVTFKLTLAEKSVQLSWCLVTPCSSGCNGRYNYPPILYQSCINQKNVSLAMFTNTSDTTIC